MLKKKITFFCKIDDVTERKGSDRDPNSGRFLHPDPNTMQRNWTTAVEDLSASEAWNMVKEDLVDMVKATVPMRPRRNPNRPPWMNQQILREIRKRKRM